MAAIGSLIRLAIRLAIPLAIALATSATASAQERVRWVEPTCVPAWWDRAALVAALRVELRGVGAIEDDEGASVVVGAAPRDCAPEQTVVTVRVGPREREIDLADTAVEARMRTLALALASALAEGAREDDGEGAGESAGDGAANGDEGEADAEADGAGEGERAEQDADVVGGAGAAIDAELGSSLADPSVPPPRRSSPTFSLALAGEGVWSPASSVGLGGARITLGIRPVPELPVAITVALRGVGGSAADPLGEVRAAWLDAWIGSALELELAPVRLAVALALGAGATYQQGVTSREDVIAHDRAHPTVALELAVGVALEIARPLSLTLEVGGQAAIVGLEARAGADPVLGIRDLLPVARLGACVAL